MLVFFFYDIYPEARQIISDLGVTLHSLATWWDVLAVAKAGGKFDAAKLAKVAVTAEVLAQTKGPKIRIHKYKNKTGYHKRMGHRQRLTQVKVTAIDAK